MGVKHFFSWFKTNFNKNIIEMSKGEKVEDYELSIDNFMIDLNGLFHNSTQKMYEYGNYKPMERLMGNNRKKKIGGIKTQIKVFEDVCNYIEYLFNVVKPKKKFILCVDGPAPLSKQCQQRQRRFRSANDRGEEEFNRFDSNSLTPGTKFMDYLTKYIDWYIRKMISVDSRWKDLEVVFSNEKCPGEGEQKCFTYMRLYGNINETYCIHGMDADLLMLSLASNFPNFWVLRDDMYNGNEFYLIDIGSSRKELINIMDWTKDGEYLKGERKMVDNWSDVGSDVGSDSKEYDSSQKTEKKGRKKRKKKFKKSSVSEDFIFLCFMVGNDFLPHVPSLEIIEGGIEDMIDVYKNVCEEYGHLTESKEGFVKINKKSLEVFLGTISQYDKGILEEKLLKKDKFFTDIILEKNAKCVDGVYKLDIVNYRKDYYINCFPEETDIKKICHEYLKGMQWVLNYYTSGVPDWRWSFKYHYAPFASELAENISTYRFKKYKETEPITPYQQLLCVLPPKSRGLIPHPLCELLVRSDSKIKKYCPEEIKVDLSGKRREWEGIVLIPMVEFDDVCDEYYKVVDKVSFQDLKRNKFGISFVYSYSNMGVYNFRSFYGDIEECCVSTKKIVL